MRELEKVLDKNEKVLWEGTPQFKPYFIMSLIIPLFIGIFFLVFTIPFFGTTLMFSSAFKNAGSTMPAGFTNMFFTPFYFMGGLFILIAIFVIVAPPIYTYLVYKKIYYAITNKRVIIQKGLIGRDFDIIDFDQISNAQVNIGLSDMLFGKNSGSILISTPGSYMYTTSRDGMTTATPTPNKLSNITDPYGVFKFFKKVSYDVKSDLEYPNKFRPQNNPGYKTKYNPKK